MSDTQTIWVENKMLQPIFDKFEGVTTLRQLSPTNLAYACQEIWPKLPAKYKLLVKNGVAYPGKGGVDVFETEKVIINNSLYKPMIPSDQWSPEINEMMVDTDYLSFLYKTENAGQLFEYFQHFDLGGVVKPGERIKLVIPTAYLSEFMKSVPIVHKMIAVTDDKGVPIDPELTPLSQKLLYDNTDEVEDLKTMSKTELLKIARHEVRPNILSSTPASELVRMISKARKY